MPETIYMDAILRPNRSLSQRGFTIVMLIVGVTSFLTGMAFLSLGALPVVGFFGLDALAFWFAFRWNFRKQSEETRITITGTEIRLHHLKADGSEKTATLPSTFSRVELDEPLTAHSWLRIEHGRTAYVIGRFLTLPERKSLAEAIRAALMAARKERYPA